MTFLLPWFRRTITNGLSENSEFTLPPRPRPQHGSHGQGTVAVSYHDGHENFLPFRSWCGGRYDDMADSFQCSSYDRVEGLEA